MCIAQDVRRREASKPVPSHHGFPQLKKTLNAPSSISRNHHRMNREDSSESIDTAATETSHTSSHDHHHREELKETAMDSKSGDDASASLVSMVIWEHQFSDRCTTPSPTRYDIVTEPPTTPHPCRQVLILELDPSSESRLYLPFL